MKRPVPVTNARGRSFVLVAGAVLSLASVACGDVSAFPVFGTTGDGVVYGQPSSREWVDRDRAPSELARAVALIPLAVFEEENARPTLGELHPELCPETPWLEQ